MEVITSLDNKHIKNLSKLLNKKYRDIEDKFLVYGDHLVEEAYNSNILLEVIITSDYECNIDIKKTYVTYEVLKKLTNALNPQKIVGVCRKLNNNTIGNKVLLLEDIQDPGNLGTIIRSSVAFSFDTIILSNNSVDMYNEKVIRASEGMLFKINIIRKDIKDIINVLKADNYTIYGTKVDGGTNVSKVDYPNKIAIVMGNEGNGVSDTILNMCDNYLYIPINNCESLNVGVATSIILYEIGKNNEIK